MAETSLPASNDRLVGEPICGFFSGFRRHPHVHFVGAFGMNVPIESINGAGFGVGDLI